jgi:hypothetical protein
MIVFRWQMASSELTEGVNVEGSPVFGLKFRAIGGENESGFELGGGRAVLQRGKGRRGRPGGRLAMCMLLR